VHFRRHYIGEILIVLILGLACMAVGAARAAAVNNSARAKTAATISSAVAKAKKIQKSDCVWGFPLLYSCGNPYLVGPSCWDTKINKVGEPQHVCGGVFLRRNRLTDDKKYCNTTYFLSPWNRELHPSGYKCYDSLLL
jgi:hypothetical protein